MIRKVVSFPRHHLLKERITALYLAGDLLVEPEVFGAVQRER